MEPKHLNTLLAIAFFSFIFFAAAQATCAPRNFTYPIPSSSSESDSSQSSSKSASVPSPESPPESSPKSSSESQPPTAASTLQSASTTASSTAATESPLGADDADEPDHFDLDASILDPLKDLLKGGGGSEKSPNPDVKKICDATDYPDICVSSITPFVSAKTDVVEVLRTAIKAAAVHAKSAIATAEGLFKEHKSDSAIAPAISDCLDNFDDVLDNFETALEALESKDTGTLNTMLSAVITDATTCADGFGGENSPLEAFDELLEKLTSNCLAIATLLK